MSPSLRMRTVVLAVVAVASQASLASMTAGEPKSAISMLQDVEEQARSGGKPAYNVVADIKAIIEKIKDELDATRADAVTEINRLYGKVGECTDDSAKRIKAQAGIVTKVDEDRQTHKTCRGDENSAVAGDHTARDEKCTARDNFLALTISDSKKETLPQGLDSTQDDKVDYVEAMSTLYCDGNDYPTKGKEGEAMDQACSTADGDLQDVLQKQKKKCRPSQAAFENAFCTWRDEVAGNCHTYGTCYNGAKSEYTNAKEELLDVKVAKWKAEMAACEKILCYCNVWQGTTEEADADATGAARSSTNATQLGHCSTFEPSTAAMDVTDLSDVADYPGCDTSAVANFPGTDAFITAEYVPINTNDRNLHGIDEVTPMIHCIDTVEGIDTWHSDWHSDWVSANPAILSEDKGSMGPDNTRKRLMRGSPQKPIAALQLDSQGGYAPIATRSDLEDMEMNDLVGKMNELMGHINSPGTSAKDMKAALAKSIESLQHAL